MFVRLPLTLASLLVLSLMLLLLLLPLGVSLKLLPWGLGVVLWGLLLPFRS